MIIEKLFTEFKRILSLTDEIIELKILPPTQKNLKEGSNLYWDETEKKWKIEYIDQHIFFLAHELGHIYLAFLYSCSYFAKQTSVPVNVRIGYYIISLVDSFVNYQLAKHDQIYSFFLDIIDIYLTKGKEGPDPSTPDLLNFYLNLYLDFNFSLKPKDFNVRKISISKYFQNFENLIIKQRLITKDQLNAIKKKLDEFKDFKEKSKATSIIFFITQVLKLIPFFNNNEVVKTIRLFFNLPKRIKN